MTIGVRLAICAILVESGACGSGVRPPILAILTTGLVERIGGGLTAVFAGVQSRERARGARTKHLATLPFQF